MCAVVIVMATLSLGCNEQGAWSPPGPSDEVALQIFPTSTTLPVEGTIYFSTNRTHANVYWDVLGTGDAGVVDQNGVYTAPATTGTFHVVASAGQTTSTAEVVVVAALPEELEEPDEVCAILDTPPASSPVTQNAHHLDLMHASCGEDGGLKPLCPEEACILIIRVNQQSMEPSGWQIISVPVMENDYASSHHLAACMLDAYPSWVGTEEFPFSDYYALGYAQPMDFGGLVLFSRQMDHPVLAASSVRNGLGEILWPKEWGDGGGVIGSCEPVAFEFLYAFSPRGEITHELRDEILEVIAVTSLVRAFSMEVGPLVASIISHFPDALWPRDSDEWFVLLEAGIAAEK